jgi:hypothetical protein
MTINGIQVDIQSIIVINSYGQQPFPLQYMYIVRANPGGDEYAPANNQTNPCSNKPCQNGGVCVFTSNTTYNCLCTAGWTGKKYFKILMKLLDFANY